MLNEKTLLFFSFKIKMKQVFTINKPHIIKNLNINNILIILLFSTHGVRRKRSTKRLQHIGNLFRKNLQLKDVC